MSFWAFALAALSFLAACGDAGSESSWGPKPGLPPEGPQSSTDALTAGAGSTGDCSGNPARCGGVTIAAGLRHTVALKSDGTVWTWGSNFEGELGDGTTTDRTTPVQVNGTGGVGSLTGITAVAAGWEHTVALKSVGTVWTLGRNFEGELGDGTTTDRTTPVQVNGTGGVGSLTGITAVAAGGLHTVALKSDGTVWTWGYNAIGQLGDGTTTDRTTPVQVKGTGGVGFLTGITAVAAGGFYTVALKSDGTVWTWGYNNVAQLGDGTLTLRKTPVQVKGTGGVGFLTGITAVAAGDEHTAALKSDGTVWSWGYGDFGDLGDGTTTNRQTTPVQVIGTGGVGFLTGITAVAAGQYHTVAVRSDGTVWTWGWNNNGELGDGTQTQRTTPVQVTGTGGVGSLTGITAVAAGGFNTVALKSDGTVWTWGRNLVGQLGDGTTTGRTTPGQASGLSLAGTCQTASTCDAGTGLCTSQATNGTACNDGNGCTQTDACQAGACVGGSPVTCTAQDACHLAGTCDPVTGTCANPAKSDGTACNDGTACTQTDTCQAGACVGGNPVTCAAPDQCHTAGTCDTTTGACSNPAKSDGSSCSDGNACTQADTCQAGACVGGNPVTCMAQDACHLAGTCDPVTGTCANPAAADGTVCNDGTACTQTDTCQAGACVGGNPVTCTAQDACHLAGTCDPVTGTCANPAAADGTACNDGTACTQTDTCQAGACVGGSPVTCTAQDACHLAGTCDPVTGTCSNPPSNDPSCSGAAPVCVTLQRRLSGSAADASIRPDGLFAGTNQGGSTFLNAGYITKGAELGRRRALLRFDLSSIPAGATITSATLGLSSTGSNWPATLEVHRATASWSENTVTWTSFASAIDPAVSASFTNAATYVGPVSVDVTSLVSTWANGAANDGLVIMETGTAQAVAFFASSEAGTVASRPKLEVCYTP